VGLGRSAHKYQGGMRGRAFRLAPDLFAGVMAGSVVLDGVHHEISTRGGAASGGKRCCRRRSLHPPRMVADAKSNQDRGSVGAWRRRLPGLRACRASRAGAGAHGGGREPPGRRHSGRSRGYIARSRRWQYHSVQFQRIDHQSAPAKSKLNYDPLTGFESICRLVSSPTVTSVNNKSPYRTLADLLDAARTMNAPCLVT
jgi:hypothetical protein